MSDLGQIKLLVLDFDGVLTDNHVYTFSDGSEAVRSYRGDGLGIERLKGLGVVVLVLSGETSPVVGARCRKLGVKYLDSLRNKRGALIFWSGDYHVAMTDIAYLGNDMNDLDCLRIVGFPFIVADAEPALRAALRDIPVRVTERKGGQGAVREVCDLIADAARPLSAVLSYDDFLAVSD